LFIREGYSWTQLFKFKIMSNTFGLTNKQIIYLYLQNNKLASYINDLINQGYADGVVTFEFGDMKLSSEITSSELMDILDIEQIKMVLEIEDTLKPIVELMESTIPDDYKSVVDMIHKTETIEPDEEDLEDEE
jgi:hypothetical protein